MKVTANLLLALVWVAVTERFSIGNLLIGFVFGVAVLALVPVESGRSRYGRRVLRVVRLVLFVLWDILLSNLELAWYAIAGPRHQQPAIVGVPLEPMSEMQCFVLTTLITLTPGTIVVELSRDRRTMYVHALRAPDPDAFRQRIKTRLERHLLGVSE